MSKQAIIMDGVTRAYPLFIVMYSFMNGLINNNRENTVLGLILLTSDILNNILKHYIFLPFMGRASVPLLGMGSRPKNCKNSGLFKDGTISNTYGMPSGHAQISWLFTTYWSLRIWHNKERTELSKIFALGLLCLSAGLVSYSRVYWAKCHTIQQVVVGGTIGIGLGGLSYHFRHAFF